MEQPRTLHKWRKIDREKGIKYIKYLSPFHSEYVWVLKETIDEVEKYMKEFAEVPLPHKEYPVFKAKVEVDHLDAIEALPELSNPRCQLDYIYIDKKSSK